MPTQKHKQPLIRKEFSTSKAPKAARDPYSYWKSKPAWRISMLEMQDPFGWHKIDDSTLDRIRNRLKDFETMTWNEILVVAKHQNHSIPIHLLCKDAKDRLAELDQDDIERIVSLHLTGQERIYGILEEGILRLLWWDPEHRVCPSIKKHT